MYGCFVYMYVCRGQKKTLGPLERELQMVESRHTVLTGNPGPIQEQPLTNELLTNEPLSSPEDF